MFKKVLFIITLLLFAANVVAQSPIHVEKNGGRKSYLILAWFHNSGTVWNETINNLTGSYETYVISYAGFNGLEPIGTPWYAPIKQELIKLIKEEKLSNLTIIGHSMGGNLASELAAEFEKEVTGLILVDAIPCMRELMMPGVPANALQYDSPFNNQMISMTDDQFKQFALNSAQGMSNDQSKKEEIVRWALAADRETYVYGYTDLLKLDLRPVLSDISTKTLILGATFPTREMTEQTFNSQYANLENKTIAFADDSKHFIMFDQPEWLYKQINNYLTNNAR